MTLFYSAKTINGIHKKSFIPEVKGKSLSRNRQKVFYYEPLAHCRINTVRR